MFASPTLEKYQDQLKKYRHYQNPIKSPRPDRTVVNLSTLGLRSLLKCVSDLIDANKLFSYVELLLSK